MDETCLILSVRSFLIFDAALPALLGKLQRPDICEWCGPVQGLGFWFTRFSGIRHSFTTNNSFISALVRLKDILMEQKDMLVAGQIIISKPFD